MSANEPVFALIYGESGTGKTSDCLYAFPTGVFFAAPGALKAARGLLGFEPDRRDIDRLEDVISQLKAMPKVQRPTAVIIDDLSLAVQREVMLLPKGKNSYDLWRIILEKVLTLAHIARRDLGCHVILNCHEQAPRTIAGNFVKGGPQLPGQAAWHLPKATDICLRVMPEEDRPMWKFAYQCNNSDVNYVTKDRNNVCPDTTPMNLAEILRAAGYQVPRLASLPWQEKVVQQLTEKLLAGGDAKKLFEASSAQLASKFNASSKHIAWTFRDALDRVVIKRTMNDPLRRMMSTLQ